MMDFQLSKIWKILAGAAVLICVSAAFPGLAAFAQTNASPGDECRVEPADYRGFKAQEVTNHWLQLYIVPQNGGRLMQVAFAGHSFLFVNPKLAGQYFPPTSSKWFNYGGDKVWLLPEGNDDEQHWVGNSDLVDDAPYSFRKVSEGKQCEIELTGPADPQTGIQISRTISIDADSSVIRFHATMKNVSGHTVDWSMQSVSQYDTSNPDATANSGSPINHDFWTFTPANPASSYLNRYHVRFGPAENPAVSVRDDGLFALHYVHMAAELWLDSPAGWLAAVDGGSHYAMVERFQFEEMKPYPGKASVIFWTNGPQVRLNSDGEMSMSANPEDTPYYLEAELNSPMCHLRPAESCTFDTQWFPTRAGAEFHGVSDAGILIQPLRAAIAPDGKLALSGSFGVFYSGQLVAHLYDAHGASLGTAPVMDANPNEAVTLQKEIAADASAARVSLHLVDDAGADCGSLGEVRIETEETH